MDGKVSRHEGALNIMIDGSKNFARPIRPSFRRALGAAGAMSVLALAATPALARAETSSTSATSATSAGGASDPFQSVNRMFFGINQVLDRLFIRPAASA
jgi:hypothetical protein